MKTMIDKVIKLALVLLGLSTSNNAFAQSTPGSDKERVDRETLQVIKQCSVEYGSCEDTDDREREDRPPYEKLERAVIRDGKADPDSRNVRELMTCIRNLWRLNKTNPYILLHHARAYYYAGSYMQAWFSLEKALKEARKCTDEIQFEDFKVQINRSEKALRQLGQRTTIVSFADNEEPDDGLIYIDGVKIELSDRNWEIPLNVGYHSILWKHENTVCYRSIEVKYRPRITRLEGLTCDTKCTERACDDSQCNNRCYWSFRYSRDRYPCDSSQCDSFHGELQRGLGLGLGIAGSVVTAIGIGFLVAAMDKDEESDKECGSASDANECGTVGWGLVQAAKTYETSAYWTIGIGGAAIVVGALTYLFSPRAPSALTSNTVRQNAREVSVVPLVSREMSGLWMKKNW